LRSLFNIIEKMVEGAIATSAGAVKITRLGHNLSSHYTLMGKYK